MTSQQLTVAVVGARGRMGATVVEAVSAADDLTLGPRLDAGDDLAALAGQGVDVAVDFTVPEVTEANVHALIDAGISVVVGTTGWTDESLGRVAEHLDAVNAERRGAGQDGLGVVVAPNFALSAVLSMRFAAQAARYFDSVEVIELLLQFLLQQQLPFYMGNIDFSYVCQGQGPLAPVENGGADFFFHLSDGNAQGRLGDKKGLSGLGKTAFQVDLVYVCLF